MRLKSKFCMAFALLSMMGTPQMVLADSADRLSADFQKLPDSQRIAVYWYWMSDNISVSGVQHDLEAMKEKGITRAYIGNIWQDDVKPGKVKVMTDEWWKVMHAALKRASELDIEIGIFNCPGWSQSGGPWVQPQQAMRYLASQSVKVKGDGRVQTIKLPSLGKDAKDVRVLAVPDLSDQFHPTTAQLQKKANEDLVQEIDLGTERTVRSITFRSDSYLLTDAVIEAKVGNEFKHLKTVHLDRTNHALNVGFHPHAPIAVSLPDTQTSQVRVTCKGGPRDCTFTAVVSDEPCVERFEEKSLGKMFQTPLPMWGEYMWPTQPEPQGSNLLVSESQVQDLTSLLKADGSLAWKAPKGQWTILRTGMLPTGVTNAPASREATGLEVDKMSREHVASHFDAFLGELLRRIPAEDRTSFKVVVEDSYETGGQNWTDDMIESFQKRYGYDPVPYIPTLYGQVIGSQDKTERFLWDLRRLIADRVAYDYVGGLRQISNQHGLTTWLECYGHWGFPSEFLMYGGQSDEVGGEFWSEGSLGDIENRAASSCAHIYGKQKVWAESCTAGGPGFSRYPYVMKQRTDRFFTEGINATLLHLFIEQPDETTFPGISAGFGNEFNRKNVWWEHMDLFSDYLRRCNLMLQQGRYVADIAYYIGEDAPKMTGAVNPPLPRGYSFDYINAEIIAQSTVQGGKLVLPCGMEYRVLVLPKQNTMRPEVIRKISSLVQQGLVVVGPRPTASPSLQDYPNADQEVQQLAQKMWVGGTYGKGRVFPDGTKLKEIMDGLHLVPDCLVDPQQPVQFIHRTLGNREIYFLSNQSENEIAFDAEFRVTGLKPELWNPVSAEQRALPQFDDNGLFTTVPIKLAANESTFIVFQSTQRPTQARENYPQPTTVAVVSSPWTVTFQSERRGPQGPQTFQELTDWTKSDNEAIRYYSGIAQYENTLSLPTLPPSPLYLNLGRVMVMGKVYVNDQYVGGVWTYPYQVNVSNYLRQGDNKIRVEVVNNWMNRLIGDQRLPESQRKTWTSVNPWNAQSTLQPSGLLGPVKLIKF